MMVIIVFGLIATLTTVSGDCEFGTEEVKEFDFTRIPISVLT